MSDEDIPLPRVLIVDDSRMVRASISKNIRDRFDVREEADGEDGWQALLVDPSIQVVISDLGMPKLDGYGLLERIRASKLSRISELPVIIISGEEDDQARVKARELGATDFITKGIGTVELVSRLDALTRLAKATRELEQSREALALGSPVDPHSGLATKAYMEWHGNQELALARRRNGDLAAMVIMIDQFDRLLADYGVHITELINRKLSKILSSKVRKEDTVSQMAPGQFAVLCPGTNIDGCAAFALRLQRAIDKLVMTYRNRQIRMTVTVGIAAGSGSNEALTLSQLIGLAVQRVKTGLDAGGNRVISEVGEIDPRQLQRFARLPVSIDHALMQVRVGADKEVALRLPDVLATLMPLLELIEDELHCGLPLDALRHPQTSRQADGEDHPHEGTTTKL
ncbi:response regulator [Nitrogeniibacter mangrovi]|uniref:response regulator n=1 Tax=Nitrogeniibacter mangrovi TaxID=2016596 RepID=UPI001E437E8E|nr:response regulator [Nitrogeniibacter mangrovi]